MLITDSFVLLNYPKTGSTFARTVIKDIYKRRRAQQSLLRRLSDRLGFTSGPFLKELILPIVTESHLKGRRDQHGCYCQIPDVYRDREVVSIVRNPYTRFLSAYEFRSWERRPPAPKEILAEHFPTFPNLDLDDYVRLSEYIMVHGRLKGRNVNGRIGNQTIQFIQMFFKDPNVVLEKVSDDYLDSDQVFEDIAPVTFLKQEALNEELAAFLIKKGYAREEAAYALSREKVNVTEKSTADRSTLWTKRAIDYIEQNDRMIFRVLAAHGMRYPRPTVQCALQPRAETIASQV